MENFSNTYTSSSTSKEIILDYAKKNDEFSTSEIYLILSGKTKDWIRKSLVELVKDRYLQRIKRGVYSLIKTTQTKTKNNKEIR